MQRSAILGEGALHAILLGVFLLLRKPFLSSFDLVEYDGTYYINQAGSMLGRSPSSGAFPIGYPAASALFLTVVRDGVRAAQVVSFLAGIGSVLIFYALARRLVSRFAAFLTLFLVNNAVLSAGTGRFILLPKTEFFGTTTPRWQTREAWLEFAGKDNLERTLDRTEDRNVLIDGAKRYPQEIFLLGRHVMPVAAILALFGALRRRSWMIAGFTPFLFYPFFTVRSEARYVLPYVPFVLLYAAVGLDHLAKKGMRTAAFVLLAVSAAAGLFINREQLTTPVSDGFQWAKKAGHAWRGRVQPGDRVGDRKPFFAFYAGLKYVEIPIAP